MTRHIILLKEQFKGLLGKNQKPASCFRNFAIRETYFYIVQYTMRGQGPFRLSFNTQMAEGLGEKVKPV
jgi:hypothetical protein